MPKHLCRCWCGNWFNSFFPNATDCGGPHQGGRRKEDKPKEEDDE